MDCPNPRRQRKGGGKGPVQSLEGQTDGAAPSPAAPEPTAGADDGWDFTTALGALTVETGPPGGGDTCLARGARGQPL